MSAVDAITTLPSADNWFVQGLGRSYKIPAAAQHLIVMLTTERN